jgi:hypothetical protein
VHQSAPADFSCEEAFGEDYDETFLAIDGAGRSTAEWLTTSANTTRALNTRVVATNAVCCFLLGKRPFRSKRRLKEEAKPG